MEQSCFLWLVMLGACYCQRLNGHVTFTLVYDKMNVKGKAITAMLGNILITFTCLVTFLPSLNYVWGLMERQQLTTLLKWPKTIVFMPYVVFLALIVAYAVMELYEEIMVLAGSKKYADMMLEPLNPKPSRPSRPLWPRRTWTCPTSTMEVTSNAG